MRSTRATRLALLAPTFALAGICCSAQTQNAPAIGELFAADSSARLVQPAGSGMSVVAGSELSAGIATARLRLYRGGQIRICPRSALSVNSGAYGLMLAMGSGTVEIDYNMVQRGSDFLLTPDFSLQLAGPGTYHFALGVNKRGDTCMKTLPGNSSQVVISELLSAGVYKTNTQEATSFKGGKLDGSSPLTEECGCPPSVPVLQAAVPAPPPPAPKLVEPPKPAPQQVLVSNAGDGTAPIPADHPGQVHVQVDTPFVFSAKNSAQVRPYAVARLNFSDLPNVFFVQEKVDPIVLEERQAPVSAVELPVAPNLEAPPKAKEKKGFFGKMKGLFGGIFHHGSS
jgi:hypothetical protein